MLTLTHFLVYCFAVLIILAFFVQFAWAAQAEVRPTASYFEFPPCNPESEVSQILEIGGPTPQFCSQWNPDFSFNGQRCCATYVPGAYRKKVNQCSPKRKHSSFCKEMTAPQKEYTEAARAGRLGNMLRLITQELGMKGGQAHCTVNNGFLANGRPIIPSEENRLRIRLPQRCSNFGTDAMIGMLEWLGREIGKTYSSKVHKNVRLTVGDISAPRGGCMFGRTGRAHASHTSGQDADVGFLSVKANEASPIFFHQQFDPKANWWLLKKFFRNPYACIKVIFLDRRHIRALTQFAKRDPDWNLYQRFIRHMPSHKNHFHIRVGDGPGLPGCVPGARPELEVEEEDDSLDATEESSILDELKSRAITPQ